MTIKPRGLHGSIQRMQELQARVMTLTPQAKDVWVGEPTPQPRPLGGQFSEILSGGFKPLNPMGDGFSRVPDDILGMVKEAADKAGIEPALFEALVGRESSFKVDAVSIAGAKGLAQLMPKMPATAPTPARMTVTPVSRFMIVDRLLLTCVRYTSRVADSSSRYPRACAAVRDNPRGLAARRRTSSTKPCSTWSW